MADWIPPPLFFQGLVIVKEVIMLLCYMVPLLYTFPILPCVLPFVALKKSSCKWIGSALSFAGRKLFPSIFPALFTVHKTRSDPGKQSTREFLVFLDRKVENNAGMIFSFWSLVFTTISLSAISFFHYFPVEASEECLERDHHGRSLYCYSASSMTPSLPIDCLDFNRTERRALHFRCYAITVTDIGIALAAAIWHLLKWSL